MRAGEGGVDVVLATWVRARWSRWGSWVCYFGWLMRATFGAGLVLILVVGCAEELIELPAEFGEVCGVEAPVRVFVHGPEEAMLGAARRIGERLFFTVYPVGEAGDGRYPYFTAPAGTPWATGVCGEAPVRIDPVYREVFSLARWPEVALACHRETGDVVSLAGSGPLDPHVVFADVGCSPAWTDVGPVARNRKGRLVLYPYPEDPRVDTVHGTALPEVAAVWNDEPIIAAAGDELLVLRGDHTLVAIDLNTRVVTTEQFGVISFVVSESGRYVLSQAVDPARPEREYDGSLSGPLLLQDRETGVGMVVLAEGQARPGQNSALRWADQGYATIGFRGNDQRIYRLRDFSSVALPNHFGPASILLDEIGPQADGRWIVVDDSEGTLHDLDLVTGALTPMWTRRGQLVARASESTLVLAVAPCCELSRADDEGSVWSVPDDGSRPTRVVGRATLYSRSPGDGSLLSLVDIDGRRRGALMRIDLATGDVRRIDDHVFAAPLEDGGEPGFVRYSVQDGERSGVWQVRLP